MSCKNCFNGCASTTSDKCVKYTGVSIPALGIDNGDSLYAVQENILQHLLDVIDGTGIIIKVPTEVLCALIENYLPDSGDININQYIYALIQSVCFLKDEIDTTNIKVDNIEADYNVGCLPTVTPSSGTHALLQATIDFLCNLNNVVTALSLNLSTNYTKTSDLPALIASLIQDEPETSLMKNKMVPFTIVEYYGSTGNFDGSGAGIGDYVEIYLCNGDNGTPDKRGRVGIGTTTGMGGGAMDPAVDPVIVGNPAYTLLSAGGANTVILAIAQLPAHNHTASANTIGAHTHFVAGNDANADRYSDITALNSMSKTSRDGDYSGNYTLNPSILGPTVGLTSDNGDHTHAITVDSIGNGEKHDNIQPVLACHYIMYIPS